MYQEGASVESRERRDVAGVVGNHSTDTRRQSGWLARRECALSRCRARSRLQSSMQMHSSLCSRITHHSSSWQKPHAAAGPASFSQSPNRLQSAAQQGALLPLPHHRHASSAAPSSRLGSAPQEAHALHEQDRAQREREHIAADNQQCPPGGTRAAAAAAQAAGGGGSSNECMRELLLRAITTAQQRQQQRARRPCCQSLWRTR